MKMEADVVIVGTGVGGLFSALSLPRDQKIIMITKSDLESACCMTKMTMTVILKIQ